jgi:anti-anti-sigma regulatory factor
MPFREHRYGAAVRRVDAIGELPEQAAADLDRILHAAVERGTRWLIVDLDEAGAVADGVIGVLLAAGRDLRLSGGELILAGAPAAVRERVQAIDRAHWPVMVADAAEALVLLKLQQPGARVPPAARKIPSLYLPRLDPE